MKLQYPHKGISTFCKLFGKTRHAYYDYLWRQADLLLRDEIILKLVGQIRTTLPRIGTRKLHYMLTPMLVEHHIEVGRDYLFDLLSDHKLLIINRKRKVQTTDSRHWMKKYTNLIKDIPITAPEQLWVSDITYLRTISGFAYLSLITDAYSHKIMGFNLRKDLAALGCIEALNMAVANRIYKHHPLIHHSDRGSQYCCQEYIKILAFNNIAISMTNNGNPYENAIAERVNGILKSEFNLHGNYLGFDQTKALVTKSIEAYNCLRPHGSCGMLTPQQAHLQQGELSKNWKNYYKQKANLTNP